MPLPLLPVVADEMMTSRSANEEPRNESPWWRLPEKKETKKKAAQLGTTRPFWANKKKLWKRGRRIYRSPRFKTIHQTELPLRPTCSDRDFRETKLGNVWIIQRVSDSILRVKRFAIKKRDAWLVVDSRFETKNSVNNNPVPNERMKKAGEH